MTTTKRGLDNRDELPSPDNFDFPSSGIEEVDRSIFNLFDAIIPFQVKIKDQSTKVPVVFSTGERFALTRRKSPIRDKNNALILPIIAIYRKSVDISPGQSGYGTAIANRDQETYTLKKRLLPEDRDYQKILNQAGLKHQDNVASRTHFVKNDIFPGNIAKPGTVATRRNGKNLSYEIQESGNLLSNTLRDNMFEIITAPYPTFMLISYEITFWTQYVLHMNQIIEVMLSRFTGQDHGFQMTSPSGFEYVAFVKSPLTTQDNFDNFSSDERIIRYTFSVDVPAYMFAPKHEGLPSPFRRYISAPIIEFGYVQSNTQVISDQSNPDGVVDQNRFILSDIDTPAMNAAARGQSSALLRQVVENPFTGESEVKYSRVLTRNERSGETVASTRITVDLETTLDSPSSES